MNPAPPVDTTEEFVGRAIPLLKEYHDKVRQMIRRARALRTRYEADRMRYGADTTSIYRAEFDNLSGLHSRLWPAIGRLTQQVSGMVDQGRVSPLTRAELQLRLAELEADVLELPALIQAYKPK